MAARCRSHLKHRRRGLFHIRFSSSRLCLVPGPDKNPAANATSIPPDVVMNNPDSRPSQKLFYYTIVTRVAHGFCYDSVTWTHAGNKTPRYCDSETGLSSSCRAERKTAAYPVIQSPDLITVKFYLFAEMEIHSAMVGS